MTPDPKTVRRYQAGVDRALSLFDASNEWADYIAFLGRLVKALQASPGDTEIPSKRLVARYLAQCLQPSLPSGVHQKALEVYSCIFSLVGNDGLARDLAIYFPGVSHALAFASLTTRPFVLALYDDYILQLPTRTLRPALKAVILSLLPGIEEETSEDFERTLNTFNTLRKAFGDQGLESIFWQDFFLASITSPTRRAGVLVYLIRYLPKLGSPTTQLPGSTTATEQPHSQLPSIRTVITPEPGLLVRCFATGLQDQHPLIQRGFLDLLVTHLPLDTAFLHVDSARGDLEILIYAATTVTLRRDMSLNRRLWSWFLGHDNKAISADPLPGTPLASPVQELQNGTLSVPQQQEATYFAQHGLSPLIQGLKRLIDGRELQPAHRARSFRIMASLVDRWEVGQPVVEQVFVPMMKNLQEYQTTAPSQTAFDEVFRSANVFFDGVESRVIWSQIFKLFMNDDFDLVEFIIDNFSLQEEEMLRVHAPLLCLTIIANLQISTSSYSTLTIDSEANLKAMRQAIVLDKLSALVSLATHGTTGSGGEVLKGDLVARIASFYSTGDPPQKIPGSPLTAQELSYILPKLTTTLLLESVENTLPRAMLRSLTSAHQKICATSANLLSLMLEADLFERLKRALQLPKQKLPQRFDAAIASTSVIGGVHINVVDGQKEEFDRGLVTVVPAMVTAFWEVMTPRHPEFVVEAIESLWTLQALSPDLQLVESTIMSCITENMANETYPESAVQSFAVLWAHTHTKGTSTASTSTDLGRARSDGSVRLLRRPLLLILDRSDSGQGEEWKDWLLSLISLNTAFNLVLNEMGDNTCPRQDTLVNLRRLRILTGIMTKSSSQLDSFKRSQEMTRALWEKLLSLAKLPPKDETVAIRSLALVRTLLQESALTPPSNLVSILLQGLEYCGTGKIENALLECLEAAIAMSESLPSDREMLPKLLRGISTSRWDANLDKWITILCNILPQYSSVVFFPNLLKITDCLCKQIKLYYKELHQSSQNSQGTAAVSNEETSSFNPERSITNLLAGLEYILARAHQLLTGRAEDPSNSLDDSKQQAVAGRSFTNNHLTIVLCMQDTVRVCEEIWSWRSTFATGTVGAESKSLHQLASRLRAKTRRILENLIDVEPQECLETLIGMWKDAAKDSKRTDTIMSLLQTLDGARPKFMMPAVFNAVYNRTSPSLLSPAQRSTMSIVMSIQELAVFLLEYSRSLEDDLLEEIWVDCTTFVREVLANPLPYRQILLPLLQFVAILCKKMENTNFGEESRMRRELAELCARIFTAIFTVKPGGLDQSSTASRQTAASAKGLISAPSRQEAQGAVRVICDSLPALSTILSDAGRLADVYMGLSNHITGPRLKSKTFPHNLTIDVLRLLQILSKAQSAQKAWKKDVLDSFNDAKLFHCPSELVDAGWSPLLQQLSMDKSFMPELIGRLTAPSTAGLVFGVGASAARNAADKATSTNVRRIAITLLSNEADTFVVNLASLKTKIEELFSATAESSPSSLIKADLYMLLRAMVLSFSQQHLISMWSAIEAELRDMLSDLVKKDDTSFSVISRLQGAKLLDLLLLMKLEEFQLHEWLFITDTVDAIYPDSTLQPAALADEISGATSVEFDALQKTDGSNKRRPWLCHDKTRQLQDPDALLKSFFSQLSIHAFEDVYSLGEVDLVACRADLLEDLFFDETMLDEKR